MSEWVETTLGEVTTFAGGYSFPPAMQGGSVSGETPFFKVSDMNAHVNQKWMFRAANTVSAAKLKVMRARIWPKGTVVFPKVGAALLTEKRRLLGQPSGFDNNVMGLLPCPPVMAEFLYYLMCTVKLGEVAQRGAVPSVNQMNVSGIPILLPPLAEQRRIVDVMAAVDAQIEALAGEAVGVAMSRLAMLDTLLTNDAEPWPKELLGSLGTFTRGRRFTKADYVDAGLGCIHYGQIYTHYGSLAQHSITFLPVEFRARMRMAEPGDLVIAATGEDLIEVGKSVAWLGDEPVAVHDDAQIFRHGLEPRYAAYVTASTDFQRQKRRLVSDMKVARVSSKDLASIRISVPPRVEQERIADVIEGFDLKCECLLTELAHLRTFRSTLLASLLSQDVVIPKSYDAALAAEMKVVS